MVWRRSAAASINAGPLNERACEERHAEVAIDSSQGIGGRGFMPRLRGQLQSSCPASLLDPVIGD